MNKTQSQFILNKANVHIRLLFFSSIILLFFSVIIYAYTTGITDRTSKSNYPGCVCHGMNPSTAVVVTIVGPDTLTQSATANYTVTITGGPLSAAGTDVAISNGILAPASSQLRFLNSELTHTTPLLPDSTGVVTFNFTYTAPKFSGVQTIYAVGNSVNWDGSSDGDEWNFAPNKTIQVIAPTGVEDLYSILSYKLEQNYPNPFNPTTTIKFDIAEQSDVSLKIYDILGEEVATLKNEILTSGRYTVEWDASKYASGVYFYKIKAGNFTEAKKMLLLK
jgi:hypothetical protein